MSIQNRVTNKGAVKNVADKKNIERINLTQNRLQSAKRVQRNPSIDNVKLNRDITLPTSSSNQGISLISVESFKKK
jgi:hypothetical protein